MYFQFEILLLFYKFLKSGRFFGGGSSLALTVYHPWKFAQNSSKNVGCGDQMFFDRFTSRNLFDLNPKLFKAFVRKRNCGKTAICSQFF
jgi:hypothetical protein